jgi:fatty-acyl-CoA synthase
MDKGIGSWPTRRAFLSGDRTALIAGERRITYTELDRRTDRLARAFRAEGVRRGDRVAGLLLNSPAFLETMLATAKLGAVFVPMNLRLSPAEVTYLLADSGADLFVYSAPLAPVARAALTGEGVRVRTRVVVGGEPADGESEFEQLLASGDPARWAPTSTAATSPA